jgi:hypothetical protein
LETPISTASVVRDLAPSRFRYVSSVMEVGLDYLNDGRNSESLVLRNDPGRREWYHRRMAAPRYDWFAAQWLKATGKKQADIVHDLDWNKAKISLMVRGLQPYTRDEVNELSEYLNIRPYELLMHPEDAMALRRLRADMLRLANETETLQDVRKVSLG